MLRDYALVIFNQKDEIIDKFNIEVVTNSSGTGFELELSTISNPLEDIITMVSQKKLPIIFTINQINESYTKAEIITNWIQKYSRPEYTMALEWKYGNTTRYCLGKVTKLTKGDRLYVEILQQQFAFTQTTPWFIYKRNIIIYEESTIGKRYPYKYPYSYGSGKVENNVIENNYIMEIPLNVIIDGAITNPIINLSSFKYENGNKIQGDVYNTVIFEDLTIEANQQLFIDSGRRKITLYTYEDVSKQKLIGQEDVTNRVSDNSDTFLRIQSGFTQLNYNRDTVDSNFKITGSWRQYTL